MLQEVYVCFNWDTEYVVSYLSFPLDIGFSLFFLSVHHEDIGLSPHILFICFYLEAPHDLLYGSV